MQRIWKVLRRWLAFAFLLGVILFGAVAMLLNTETGSRFVINRVTAFVPGSLYVDGVEGTLWRTINARVLGYRNEKIDLTAGNVVLTINWPGALAGLLVLNQLDADEVDVRNLVESDGGPDPVTVAMLALPYSITVRDLQVGTFKLTGSTTALQIDDIDAERLRLGGTRIRATELSATVAETAFRFTDVDTNLSEDVPIAAEFTWRQTDPDRFGQGSLAGSLTSLSVSHDLQSPLAVATTGTVKLLGRLEPEFDLRFLWQQYVTGSTEIRDGDVRIAGARNDYQATVNFTVADPRIPELRITGGGIGNLDGLQAGEYLLQSQVGAVLANGAVAWRPALSADMDLVATDVDPSFWDERFTGLFAGTTHFELSDSQSLKLSDIKLEGSLNDTDVVASGDVAVSPDGLQCVDCIVNLRRDENGGMTLDARVDGTPGSLNVDMEMTAGESISIDASGTLASSVAGISGTVHRAAMEEQYTGRWVLQTPLTFRSGDAGIDVDAHRWLLPEGQIEVTRIGVAEGQLAVVAELDGIPLAAANSYLPAGYRLDGHANANIDVIRDDETWSGSARWQQSGTVLHVAQTGDETYSLQIPEFNATALLADGGANIEATIAVDPGVSLGASLKLASLSRNPQIDGSLQITGEQWDWITALVPELDNLAGDISADLGFTGPLLSPEISGEASWLNGSADIPALNVPLSGIDVTASGAPDGSARINGSAMAGTGRIAMKGMAEALLSNDRRIELSLTGDTAELMNWPEYKLWASPDLLLVGSSGGWDASGKLEIPRAEIAVRQLPENAVTVSADVRTTDQDLSTSITQARYSGEATVVFSDDVHISAFGLDTRLGGELVVRKSPDQEMTAEGRVELVDGEFVAYGQKLKIEEGTLTFTGPLDDPIVDIRATRTIEDFDGRIVAGIRLQGRAKNITSTIYSEPTMSEADALSYLMIGRPLAQATETEGGDLSSAAVGLGLRQATRITQEIGQSLGLDELTIIGDGGDATALVAGKQFNSRLYARYAYGVFSQVGMILIRYRLTERLSLEAGAGETQSIDILYSVETR